jgi:hypothetical protein
MDEQTTALDGRITAGRKGMPYDWRGVLATAFAAPAVTFTDEALAGLIASAEVSAR